ncbi:unnamed protein product [Symbiodinium natans]|uniref:Uncharacterized protein n=1 Tax=Symbiodinium natans TaxID=878477 RepID=A0A812RU71_9DINO|nr:unnamed protein product [Symbiodinium natans]
MGVQHAQCADECADERAGQRESGADVRSANVTAVMAGCSDGVLCWKPIVRSHKLLLPHVLAKPEALANILKSSLGPQGLDKMLVDDIGDVTITNDGATVLKQLEARLRCPLIRRDVLWESGLAAWQLFLYTARSYVEHPAAKVLVELANLQDSEVGDGTTSVVIIAAELRLGSHGDPKFVSSAAGSRVESCQSLNIDLRLKRANELVKNNIHPTTIIAGYRLAMRESIKYIQEHLSLKVDTLEQAHFPVPQVLQVLLGGHSLWQGAREARSFFKRCFFCWRGFGLLGRDTWRGNIAKGPRFSRVHPARRECQGARHKNAPLRAGLFNFLEEP